MDSKCHINEKTCESKKKKKKLPIKLTLFAVVLLSSWTGRPTGTTEVPALRLANPEMRPRYLFIIYYSSSIGMFYNNNNNILQVAVLFGVRVSGTVIVVIYCDNILHSTCAPLYPRTPRDSSNTYARGTPGPD